MRNMFILFLLMFCLCGCSALISLDGITDRPSESNVEKIKKRKVYVQKNADLSKIMGKDIINTHYIIRNKHDLGRYDKKLIVGDNCILEFINGSICNGQVLCNNIEIRGRKAKLIDTYIKIKDANFIKINNLTAQFNFAVDDFVKIVNSSNISMNHVDVFFDEDNRQIPSGDFIEAEGFDLQECQNIVFQNCSVLNSKSHYSDSEHGSLICKECDNVKINKCYSSGGHNEAFNFINCNDVIIINTTVKGGSGSAITTKGGAGFIIDKCKSYNVGASGYSLNSKSMQITNSLAQDWKIFNGFTIGHNVDGLIAKDVYIENCKMIQSTNIDSHKKCAFGGVIDGKVIIMNCEIITSRLCSFDGNLESADVSLTLDNNNIECFDGDKSAEFYRVSNVYNLVISGNNFKGNASLSLFDISMKELQDRNGKINVRGNTFNKGAFIKNAKDNINNKNIIFEGNIKDDKAYLFR